MSHKPTNSTKLTRTPPHDGYKLGYTELNKPPTWWEQFKDMVLVILLLALFTAPIWLQAFGLDQP